MLILDSILFYVKTWQLLNTQIRDYIFLKFIFIFCLACVDRLWSAYINGFKKIAYDWPEFFFSELTIGF